MRVYVCNYPSNYINTHTHAHTQTHTHTRTHKHTHTCKHTHTLTCTHTLSPGYSIHRSYREDRRAGGVALLINNNLHDEFISCINITGIESIRCKILTRTESSLCPIIVGAVYCSPSCLHANFEQWLLFVNHFLDNKSLSQLILLGDFNLPHYDWSIPCTTNADSS